MVVSRKSEIGKLESGKGIRCLRFGSATLYHGDALQVLQKLPPKQADFCFTDPSYGHNNNNGDLISNLEAALGRGEPGLPRPIKNYGPEATGVFSAALPLIARQLSSGGCCCCCCCSGGGPDPHFARWSLLLDEVFDFKQMVVWDKGPMGLGWHYRRSYETVLVASKPGGKCRWYDKTCQVENILRPGDYGIRKIIPTVDQHPTQKPIALARHFIRLHSRRGDTVLDPFMGSGTTGVAAVLTGRKFIGIELDRRWFRQACERIQAAIRNPNCQFCH
jgi:DNA modification methylase